MIRTLTFVFVLALLGGAAVGFFAKETIGRPDVPAPFSHAADPRIEERLTLYRKVFHLDDAAIAELRAAHQEYYRALEEVVRVRVAQLLQEIETASPDDPSNPNSRDRRRLDEVFRRFQERQDRVLPEWFRARPDDRGAR